MHLCRVSYQARHKAASAYNTAEQATVDRMSVRNHQHTKTTTHSIITV